jgi:hypothetical protein
MAQNGDRLTISILNNFGAPIQTKHENNPGQGIYVDGKSHDIGVLQHGECESFVVGGGFGGNVFFVESGGGRTFAGAESLVEVTFQNQGNGGNVIDVDVSYV